MCHLCPHVKICCFCYSLRTGSFIIGWIYLVLSIIGFLASIFVSLFHLTRSDDLLDKLCDCSGLVRTDYEWNRLWEVCQNKCNVEMSNRDTTNTFMWYNISDLILSVALLVGVAGNVPVLLLVFVYGFNIVFLAYNVLVLSILVYYESFRYATYAVLSHLIGWVFIFYSCIVVSSLYRTMVKADEYSTEDQGLVYT